jgi:hypothetical protein
MAGVRPRGRRGPAPRAPCVPLALGEPFLSGTVVGTSIVGREIKVATSLIFDVGVMSIVLGMVGTFVVALGQER